LAYPDKKKGEIMKKQSTAKIFEMKPTSFFYGKTIKNILRPCLFCKKIFAFFVRPDPFRGFRGCGFSYAKATEGEALLLRQIGGFGG
jgi:hypothetical protein